jgi:hypothetical protein
VQVEEDVLSETADRVLRHLREDRVPEFVEAGRPASERKWKQFRLLCFLTNLLALSHFFQENLIYLNL